MYNDKEKIKKSRNKSKKGRRFFFLPFKNNERILSKNERRYFKVLNGELIINLILIIIGVLLCFIEFKVNILLGIVLVLYGLIKMWGYLLKEDISLFNLNIIYSIVGIIIGIVTMFVNINVMLGIWFIFVAIVNGDLVIKLKQVNEKCWNLILMNVILILFIGILTIINPFVNLSYYQVIGAFLILYGVLSSNEIFMLKNRSYNFIR